MRVQRAANAIGDWLREDYNQDRRVFITSFQWFGLGIGFGLGLHHSLLLSILGAFTSCGIASILAFLAWIAMWELFVGDR